MTAKRGTGKRQDGGKRGGPPWVLLFVLFFGVVLIGGVGIGAWVLWKRVGPALAQGGGGPLSEEMRYAPDDVSSIEIRRLDQILADPDYQKLRAEFPRLHGVERDSMANVPAAEVERATVAHGKGHVTILRMKKPVTADLIKQWDGRGAWMAPENVSGYTLHAVLGAPVDGEHNNSSFCVASSKIVLLGFARDLRAVLRRVGKATPRPQLEQGLKLVDLDKHLIKVVVCEGSTVQIGNDNPMSPKTLQYTKKPGVVVKASQTQIGQTVEGITVYLCTDAEAANGLQRTIMEATDKQASDDGKTGAALFAKQSVTTTGNVVTVRDSHSMDAYVARLKEINKR